MIISFDLTAAAAAAAAVKGQCPEPAAVANQLEGVVVAVSWSVEAAAGYCCSVHEYRRGFYLRKILLGPKLQGPDS